MKFLNRPSKRFVVLPNMPKKGPRISPEIFSPITSATSESINSQEELSTHDLLVQFCETILEKVGDFFDEEVSGFNGQTAESLKRIRRRLRKKGDDEALRSLHLVVSLEELATRWPEMRYTDSSEDSYWFYHDYIPELLLYLSDWLTDQEGISEVAENARTHYENLLS